MKKDESSARITFQQNRKGLTFTAILSYPNQNVVMTITSAAILTSNVCDDVVYYELNVSHNNDLFIIVKRFSQFVELDRNLRKAFPGRKLPHLPPKHVKFTTDHIDQEFIASRQIRLAEYVQALLEMGSPVSTSEEMIEFFKGDIVY